MKVLQTLRVDSAHGRSEVRLLHGDLMDVGESKPVDILVVSTFPLDYAPTRKSVVEALLYRGLVLGDLARDKAIDLGPEYSSWLSRDISALGSGVRARRILCIEEPDPQRLFRSLVAVLADAKTPATVAMPVIGTGDQGLSLDDVLPKILDAAVHWIKLGLPVAQLDVVVRTPDVADEVWRRFMHFHSEREADESRGSGRSGGARMGRRGFGASKDAPAAPEPKTPPRYDVFVSYCHADAASSDLFVAALEERGRRVFQDRKDLDPGAIWQHEIYTSLDQCNTIVPLLSPHYLSSAMCIEEFNIAMIRRRSEKSDVLAPIYLATATLPTYMKLVQWIDCREEDRAKLSEAAAKIASLG